jgi:hypothetical protein
MDLSVLHRCHAVGITFQYHFLHVARFSDALIILSGAVRVLPSSSSGEVPSQQFWSAHQLTPIFTPSCHLSPPGNSTARDSSCRWDRSQCYCSIQHTACLHFPQNQSQIVVIQHPTEGDVTPVPSNHGSRSDTSYRETA